MDNMNENYDNMKAAKKLSNIINQYQESLKPITNLINNNESLNRLVRSFENFQESVDKISKPLLESGIIKNTETIAILRNSTLFSENFMNQIRLTDSVLSIIKIQEEFKRKLDTLNLPHIELYSNIIKAINNEDVIPDLTDSINIDQNEVTSEDVTKYMDEEIKIKHPKMFDTALKINVYVTITENYIQNNNVSDEEKTAWKKYILPVLSILFHFFMSWALSNTPVTDTNIVKTFENVVQIIEEYQYPFETTDPTAMHDEQKN